MTEEKRSINACPSTYRPPATPVPIEMAPISPPVELGRTGRCFDQQNVPEVMLCDSELGLKNPVASAFAPLKHRLRWPPKEAVVTLGGRP